MDDFARRAAEDRRAYIEEAASRRNLTPVCWHKGQAVLTSRSNSADEVCAGRTNGIVVQQF